MIIPEQFEFMSQQWTIRTSQPREMPEDMGQCKLMDLEVVIDPAMPVDLERQVLWHELIHVIEQVMNLELTEAQVDSLSLGLVHMLRTNPELLMTFINQE